MKLIACRSGDRRNKNGVLDYFPVLFSSVVRIFCACTDHHLVSERLAGKQNSLAVAEQIADKL